VTADNRKQNVADELVRAAQCLAAAEALVGLGLAADAISRAYYAAFHLVRALLFSRGTEPRSHQGGNPSVHRPKTIRAAYRPCPP